jgi:pyrophosphate--fructose-6-phosphate 1-phosphotransferase
LISEEVSAKKMTLEQVVGHICDLIVKRSQAGMDFGVIIIPEGLFEAIPNMATAVPPAIAEQFEHDPHGNLELSKIETERLLMTLVKEELKKRSMAGKFSAVGHFMGYEARCAFPSRFDATYCFALGQLAGLLVISRVTGYMAALRHLTRPVAQWSPVALPLVGLMDMEERRGKLRPVIQKALVDLQGAPFKAFAHQRFSWEMADLPRQIGPIQFFGPEAIRHASLLTLQLEYS